MNASQLEAFVKECLITPLNSPDVSQEAKVYLMYSLSFLENTTALDCVTVANTMVISLGNKVIGNVKV